ncbi:hypothetical protein COCNU_06G004890 [Cocos nucifera]|uniref:Uncharacterized protein n=1 Tax=Cocos nucifera TaxID=13894 RepID=A0A8K0N2K7_COCNU|nr:hypothetical protein COCNU_06G004890 [Cocos nucifera]
MDKKNREGSSFKDKKGGDTERTETLPILVVLPKNQPFISSWSMLVPSVVIGFYA